jgi:hypothetical protein
MGSGPAGAPRGRGDDKRAKLQLGDLPEGVDGFTTVAVEFSGPERPVRHHQPIPAGPARRARSCMRQPLCAWATPPTDTLQPAPVPMRLAVTDGRAQALSGRITSAAASPIE